MGITLTIDHAVKRFGETLAVQDVSLQIDGGELFFLLGPSGCGKTTLIRAIAGFCELDSGHILFDGRRVDDLPAHRRNTGMVFQNYALWPHLTVAENVAFGLSVPSRDVPRAEREQRVREALARVHLEALVDRRPNALSGGQQQRVALARALVVRPDCLLLDEPLSNLDAKLRQEMRVEIRRLVKAEGITAIYVTHDQQEALSMADRCAVLRDGRVEQIGTPRDLYERPANRFMADFIGGANLIPGTVTAIEHDGVRVATALGEWLSRPGPQATAAGAAVVLAIRPEQLALTVNGATGVNLFDGRLIETMYYGYQVECWIEARDGTALRFVADARAAALPPPPALIRFHSNPADVLVLEENGHPPHPAPGILNSRVSRTDLTRGPMETH